MYAYCFASIVVREPFRFMSHWSSIEANAKQQRRYHLSAFILATTTQFTLNEVHSHSSIISFLLCAEKNKQFFVLILSEQAVTTLSQGDH